MPIKASRLLPSQPLDAPKGVIDATVTGDGSTLKIAKLVAVSQKKEEEERGLPNLYLSLVVHTTTEAYQELVDILKAVKNYVTVFKLAITSIESIDPCPGSVTRALSKCKFIIKFELFEADASIPNEIFMGIRTQEFVFVRMESVENRPFPSDILRATLSRFRDAEPAVTHIKFSNFDRDKVMELFVSLGYVVPNLTIRSQKTSVDERIFFQFMQLRMDTAIRLGLDHPLRLGLIDWTERLMLAWSLAMGATMVLMPYENDEKETCADAATFHRLHAIDNEVLRYSEEERRAMLHGLLQGPQEDVEDEL